MYTELAIGVRFKYDLPDAVRDTLTYMATSKPGDGFIPCDDHPLYRTDRWRWMLQSGGSYYFPAQPCLVWRYDDIARAWFLTVWTNIKNYTDEWGHFLDYIAPHIDADNDDYIGTYRYEEADHPTLLYVRHGAIVRRQPEGAPS